ncbi:MAG: hypothetical protein JAY63_10750 [Candidatus Thiodiazotropha taylori]|nr:hypothetical protein [Candidatus Thiodiazotropha taylori]
MTTIFTEPGEWDYVFEMWDEWAEGPDGVELPEIYLEESHIRKVVRNTAVFFEKKGYDSFAVKLDELDYELSKCEYVCYFRCSLPMIKATLIEMQAVAQGLIKDELSPLAELGRERKEQQRKFVKVANEERSAERAQEWERWNREAQRLIKANPSLSGNKSALARHVKKNLNLEDSERTIRNRL